VSFDSVELWECSTCFVRMLVPLAGNGKYVSGFGVAQRVPVFSRDESKSEQD
jgi:hypothetical protein